MPSLCGFVESLKALCYFRFLFGLLLFIIHKVHVGTCKRLFDKSHGLWIGVVYAIFFEKEIQGDFSILTTYCFFSIYTTVHCKHVLMVGIDFII